MLRNEQGTQEEQAPLLAAGTTHELMDVTSNPTNRTTGNQNNEERNDTLPANSENRNSGISRYLTLISTIFYLLGQISIAVLIGFYYTARAETGFQEGLEEINNTYGFGWTGQAVKKFIGAICSARATGPNLFGASFPRPDSNPDSFDSEQSYPTLKDVVNMGLYQASPFAPLLGSLIAVDVLFIFLFLQCAKAIVRNKAQLAILFIFLCKLIPSTLFLACDFGELYGACQALKQTCNANNFDDLEAPLVTIDDSTNPYHSIWLTTDMAADNKNAFIIAAFLFHAFISLTHIIMVTRFSPRRAATDVERGRNRTEPRTTNPRQERQQAIGDNAQRVRDNLQTTTPLTPKDKLDQLIAWNPNFLRELPNDFLNQIPFLFTCPVTLEFFNDPVMASDGHNYERRILQGAVASNQTSPLTREKLKPLREITTANNFGLPNKTLARQKKQFVQIIEKAWEKMQIEKNRTAPELEEEKNSFPHLANFSPS